MDLPPIASEEEYTAALGQLEPWCPAIRAILRHHGFACPEDSLRLGRGGTYPTVLVGGEHVVKLFGPWWCGPESLEAEWAAYALLTGRGLPVPTLRGHGQLHDDWSYLVLEQLRGRDLRAERARLDDAALASLAGWLGRFCRDLRRVELPLEGYLSTSWDRFHGFLAERRRELLRRSTEKSRLAPHLHEELAAWLPDVDELIDTRSPPVLLHGDLHDHHVFGTVGGPTFAPTGVIDFTDVLTGDPYYDIGPLHVHMFRSDRRLLATWREAAALPVAGALAFPKRALAYTLLHEFDPIYRLRDKLAALPTLDAVAEELFGEPA